MAKTKYSFWITLKKARNFLFELLLAGCVVYITENPNWIFLAPVFEGLRNYIKTKYK